LGRLATRRGEFDAAAQLLAEARGEFVALQVDSLVVDTDVRLVERDVWRGEIDAVLSVADAIERSIAEASALPALAVCLARLRAWAVTRSDPSAATMAWEHVIARARDLNSRYELALALDGMLCSAGEMSVDPDGAAERERDDLLRRMGVVRPPRPPWIGTVCSAQAGIGGDEGG
jgi:hypothetical protein